MGVYVYVDGFNLYYRLYKNGRRRFPLPEHYKWLNLLELCRQLAPGQDIDWIGYFTAFVSPNPRDSQQHVRQRAYIEALRTISCLEVVPGNFQPTTKRGVPHGQPNTQARLFDTFEEKGSDVNLASRLVWDAARDAFSEAFVISNDSDLAEAVRIATKEAGKSVHVISPDINVSSALTIVATSATPLDTKLLKKCLFPETLSNANGVLISRPDTWAPPLPTRT